jgi:hypothetical protein
MIDYEKLQRDLARARKVAITRSASVKDDGSMSADYVHIPTGPSHAIKRTSKRLDELTDGIRVTSTWWRGYLITPPGEGVASRRLAAAQSMATELKRLGWGACVYYQRD